MYLLEHVVPLRCALLDYPQNWTGVEFDILRHKISHEPIIHKWYSAMPLQVLWSGQVEIRVSSQLHFSPLPLIWREENSKSIPFVDTMPSLEASCWLEAALSPE